MSKKAKKKAEFPEEVYVQADTFDPSYFSLFTKEDRLDEGRVAVYRLHKEGKVKRSVELED